MLGGLGFFYWFWILEEEGDEQRLFLPKLSLYCHFLCRLRLNMGRLH